MKKVNQELLEKIKMLREKEQENQYVQNEVNKSYYKKELFCLRRRNQDLLIQIRKLKHDNKKLFTQRVKSQKINCQQKDDD